MADAGTDRGNGAGRGGADDDVGLAEVELEEVGLEEAGLAEVGLEEIGLEPTAGADPQPRPIAFAELYAAEFVALVRMATLIGGNPELARDVVQDAFVRLHVAWPRVRDPLSYVRRSVVNGCRSQARWDRRRRGRPVTEERVVEAVPDELGDALATLPHRQRAAIVLRFYEGRTEAEIASLLGCRPGTVGSLIHRGLTSLRPLLED